MRGHRAHGTGQIGSDQCAASHDGCEASDANCSGDFSPQQHSQSQFHFQSLHIKMGMFDETAIVDLVPFIVCLPTKINKLPFSVCRKQTEVAISVFKKLTFSIHIDNKMVAYIYTGICCCFKI